MSSKQQFSDTGKTVEDYRNIIKQLKLKTRDLQLKNQELEDKISEIRATNYNPKKIQELMDSNVFPIQTHNDDKSFSLSTNDAIMREVLKNCQKLGINLEAIFRIIDKDYKNVVQLDEFKIFLNRVRLGLNSSQITRFLYVIDDDCSGTITREKYADILMAYGVNQEPISQSARTLGQQTLLYYVTLMKQTSNMTPQESFNFLDTNKQDFFNSDQFSDFFKKLDSGISRKERASLFHYMDIDNKHQISRQVYMDVIEKAYKGLGEQSRPQTSQYEGTVRDDPSRPVTAYSKVTTQLENPRNKPDNYKQQLQATIQKYEQHTSLPITNILMDLLLALTDPARGILFYDFQILFESMGNFLTNQEQFILFKALDTNQNGNLNFDDTFSFFMEYKSNQSDYTFLLVNKAKELESQKKSTVSFLAENNIQLEDELDIDSFTQKMKTSLGVFKEECASLFNQMDDFKDSNGKITGQEIVDIMNAIRGDVDVIVDDAPQQIQVKQNNKKSNGQKQKLDPQEFYYQNKVQDIFVKLDRIYPEFKNEDHFVQEGNVMNTMYQGQNGHLAALRYCLLQLEMMKREKQQLWNDPEFGRTKEDQNGFKSMYVYENMLPPNYVDPDNVEWQRPSEICKNQIPCFEDQEGLEADDVIQSAYLGNCWFVSALSIVASRNDTLIKGFCSQDMKCSTNLSDDECVNVLKGMYPPLFHFLSAFGIYVCRFFKNQKWVYVVIDDTLPVINGQLMYGQCRTNNDESVPNEFWVSIIEKAYAKLHGSYQSLISGGIDEGLQDMTGLASERRDISPNDFNTEKKKDEFWEQLNELITQKCMIGCSASGTGVEHGIEVDGVDCGLKSGHAYAILDTIEIPKQRIGKENLHQTHRLIRIRNPWGFGEWQLKWSEEYYKEQKDAEDEDKPLYYKNLETIKKEYLKKKQRFPETEDFNPNGDDGTFLMSYKDWRQIFTNLFINIDFEDKWTGMRVLDKWENSGGFPMNQTEQEFIRYAENNQYLMEINNTRNDTTQVFITCAQQDGRLIRGLKYPYQEIVHSFNMLLWKLDPNEQKLEKFVKGKKMVVHSGKLKVTKEISIPRQQLPNGKYVIIPSTKDSGKNGNFALSVYYDQDCVKLTKIGSQNQRFEEIAEESEQRHNYPQELKDILHQVLKYSLDSQ